MTEGNTLKDLVKLAIDLFQEPEIYDANIGKELIDLLLEMNDFDMAELEPLKESVSEYWNMPSTTTKHWGTEEIMNLALVSVTNYEVKECLLKFIKADDLIATEDE
jgi:hypothetical protein